MNDTANGSARALEREWLLMQTQFDSYEKHSLLIKLTSILLLGVAGFIDSEPSAALVMLFLLVVLWLQDSIWKTFQARIEARLLDIERSLRDEADVRPYQFNLVFQDKRPGSVGLIREYLAQSVRPTMLFPHAFLVGAQGIICLA